ncbi:EH domain-containing protein 1-like protein [Tanacetum coccineum]
MVIVSSSTTGGGGTTMGVCSKDDQKIYQQWFNYADSDGDGRITGDDATKFFVLSNLDKSQLKQVWAIADSKRQGYLGFKEFIIAMQLLSLAQAGHELNSNLLKSSPSDVELLEPPEMEGLDSLLLFSLSSRQKHRGSRNNGVLETNGILAVQHVSPLSLFSTRLSKKKNLDEAVKKLKQQGIEVLGLSEIITYDQKVFAALDTETKGGAGCPY